MKLQSVLQENPRRIRPSLRKSTAKERTEADMKTEPIVKEERTPTFRKKHIGMTTEVWEIDSDSDIEILGNPEAAMAAPSGASPKVSWIILDGSDAALHVCHDSN